MTTYLPQCRTWKNPLPPMAGPCFTPNCDGAPLVPYAGRDPRTYQMASIKTNGKDWEKGYKHRLYCPSVPDSEVVVNSNGFYPSIGINAIIYCSRVGSNEYRCPMTTLFKIPSRTYVFLDAGSLYACHGDVTQVGLSMNVKFRHFNSTNVSFIDGHAETIKMEKLSTDKNNIGWTPYKCNPNSSLSSY